MKIFKRAIMILLLIFGLIAGVFYGSRTYRVYKTVSGMVSADGGFYVDAVVTSIEGGQMHLHADRHDPSEYDVTTERPEMYHVGETLTVLLDQNKHGVGLRNDWDLDMKSLYKNGLFAILGLGAFLIGTTLLIFSIMDARDDKYEDEQDEYEEEVKPIRNKEITYINPNLEEEMQKELSKNVKKYV